MSAPSPPLRWREWCVTLHREGEPPSLLAVHACSEHAAMTVVRYVLDAEHRASEDEPLPDAS